MIESIFNINKIVIIIPRPDLWHGNWQHIITIRIFSR